MGYRGKLVEREAARSLRAQSWTQADIAEKLGVSKSSVSLWVRDVEFVANARRTARRRGPNVLQRRKAEEIEHFQELGVVRLGDLSEQAFLAAGAALYAGEGAKRDGAVVFANTDFRLVRFFCSWLRTFFQIDETRLRARVYLHQGLDIGAAEQYWSEVTGIPLIQFGKPYRAVTNSGYRQIKHENGCVYVRYCSSRTHRAIIGVVDALLSSQTGPG
jgi:transcriptional regulator with XRE-family HTH domain